MPSWTKELESRLASLRLHPAREREIIDELSEHLELRYAELRDQGVDEAEAFALVRAELLDDESLATLMRPLRQANAPPPPVPMGAGFGVFGDIRYAARRLSRSPGFTLAAILTIALGVGLNTGTFSILNGVVLRDLPVPESAALVMASQSVDGVPGRNEKGRQNPRFTTAEFEAYRDRSETLVGLMGYSLPWPAALGGAAPREITGRYVTCGYFDVLRQPPALGRALTAEDCARGAAPVVVLSHAFWSASYGADPSIVGRSISMNDQSFTVVGIAAADAYEPGFQRLDYYVPITAQPLSATRPPVARQRRVGLARADRPAQGGQQPRAGTGRAQRDRGCNRPSESGAQHCRLRRAREADFVPQARRGRSFRRARSSSSLSRSCC